MKLALNLTREKLVKQDMRFAKQAGCDGIIAHLINFNKSWMGEESGPPLAVEHDPIWSYDSLLAIKKSLAEEGLEFYGIENFNPGDWHDILLDGPRRAQQIETIKNIIRAMGRVGIPYMGYNFSLTGVYGRVMKPEARAGATTMTFDADNPHNNIPIPLGQVWDMVYDPDAPAGNQPIIENDELWRRCKAFLEEVVPVAEEAGVMLGAHPDDPPVPRLRQNAKLIYKSDQFQKLVDLVPSKNSGIELCIGTLQEMQDSEVYETIESLARQGKVAYVHLRNVKGKVPRYVETFIDEGELDIFRALQTLKEGGFTGPVVPDHTPDMATGTPWHTSMAYALGYIKAAMKMLGISSEDA